MQRNCDACGKPYDARTPRSKYCAEVDCKRARERARNRRRASGDVVPFPQSEAPADGYKPGPNERITRTELEKVERLDTIAGQNAMSLARRLDQAAGDTGSSFAALAKQHLAAVEKALEGVVAQADPIDRRKQAMQERRLSVVR